MIITGNYGVYKVNDQNLISSIILENSVVKTVKNPVITDFLVLEPGTSGRRIFNS